MHVKEFQLKRFLHHRGRFDNPEYSANTVSRYVGFAIINFLMTGFKAVVMVRLFELYDDISENVRVDTLVAKLRALLAYNNPSYYGSPARSKEATLLAMSIGAGPR